MCQKELSESEEEKRQRLATRFATPLSNLPNRPLVPEAFVPSAGPLLSGAPRLDADPLLLTKREAVGKLEGDGAGKKVREVGTREQLHVGRELAVAEDRFSIAQMGKAWCRAMMKEEEEEEEEKARPLRLQIETLGRSSIRGNSR